MKNKRVISRVFLLLVQLVLIISIIINLAFLIIDIEYRFSIEVPLINNILQSLMSTQMILIILNIIIITLIHDCSNILKRR